jgi:hypothetical protein
MNTAQEVGIGSLVGGGAAVLTNLGLRYFADDKLTQPTEAGEVPSRPFLYEHAPLLGLIPVGLATAASYYWLGGAPAAVGCFLTGLFAATAAPIDDWVCDARAEKDAAEVAEPDEGVKRYGGYGARLRELNQKVA